MRRFVVFLALILLPLAVSAAERSQTVRRHFMHLHPCPSTLKTSGSCPGYVVDHIVALKCGGSDAVGNMQWQTLAEGKAKDRWETKGCK